MMQFESIKFDKILKFKSISCQIYLIVWIEFMAIDTWYLVMYQRNSDRKL